MSLPQRPSALAGEQSLAAASSRASAVEARFSKTLASVAAQPPTLNPKAQPFTPGASQAFPFAEPTSSARRREWADLDSDAALSDIDGAASDDEGSVSSSAASAASPYKEGTTEFVPATLAETLSRSLLIQSFNGLARSQPHSGASTSERLSPDSHDSPTPVARQALNTTVGFALAPVPETDVAVALAREAPPPMTPTGAHNSRVSMPVAQHGERRHGYAGLLDLAQTSGRYDCEAMQAPALEPVRDDGDDERVRSLPVHTYRWKTVLRRVEQHIAFMLCSRAVKVVVLLFRAGELSCGIGQRWSPSARCELN